MSTSRDDALETPLGMLMEAQRLLSQGRKYGLRVVATPHALNMLTEMANLYRGDDSAGVGGLTTNIVSTDHLFEPGIFPGVQIDRK